MSRPRKEKALRRDAYLAIRLPQAVRDRLEYHAKRELRDLSNLALFLLCRGLDDLDRTASTEKSDRPS
jgi:hypothetical protein